MDPLELVALPRLMALTRGKIDLIVGILDGPVAFDHPDLATGNLGSLPGTPPTCNRAESLACRHGTFTAGILAARRGARAPAIAPDCTFVVRPVFSDNATDGEPPSTTPQELADAIIDCVDAGADILNLSAALISSSIRAERELEEALRYAVARSVLIVVAAGNQGSLMGSAIVRQLWVIPVVAYGGDGRPLPRSNLGRSVGARGLGGPGERVVGLGSEGATAVSGGTSVATAFVSGAAALLWSAFPEASAGEIRHALLSSSPGRRNTVVPRLMDAWAAYGSLSKRSR